jgi:glycosyltransferase involved in cell wall biosynthesis
MSGEQRIGSERPTVHWVNQYAVTPDQPGGTRHHEMAAALRGRGYDVRLVASDLNLTTRVYSRRKSPADRRPIAEDVAGVPFTWLPAGRYDRNDWRRALSMVTFAWEVLLFLVRNVRRGDVVIGSSPQLLAAAAARVAALLRGGRFVLEVRDLWPESLTGVSGRRSPTAIVLRIVADALYRSSRAIVILAEGSREPIVRHGGRPARIVFVPNGVDVEAFAVTTGELPTDLSWIEERPTFVYAGAHGPANGLDLVLDAAERLQDHGQDDLRILLVGDGPVKADLQRDAQQRALTNVVFRDPVPKQVIPAILQRCAGGLMVLKNVELFRYGVSPNKLFDYLACDLPVVTNVPGNVARTVADAEAGIVVPPGDPEALADAMVAVAAGEVASGSGARYVKEHRDRRLLADRLARVVDAVAR